MRPSPLLALAFAAAFAALMAFPSLATPLLAATLLWALTTPAHALQSLALAAVLTYVNPGLVALGTEAGLLIRIVLLAAALRVLPGLRLRQLAAVWPAWVFAAVAGVASITASAVVDVSLMKVAIFFLATTTAIGACSGLRATELERFRDWLATLILAIVGSSMLAMLLQPSAAFAANGYLKGILSHSQALATVIAPVAAATLAGVLLMRDRPLVTELLLVGAMLVVMLMTQARTAAIAVSLGLLCAFVARALRRRDRWHARAGRTLAIVATAALAIGIAALATGRVGDAIAGFVLKRGTDQTLGEAFEASRGGGALAQWNNFTARPLTGYGFGIYPDGNFPSGVTRVWGLPVSAPVEKGFLPSAVLEETGLFGGLALLLLVVRLVRVAWRERDLRMIATCVACLAVNLGESILTAPGGVGMLIWLMLAASAVRPRAARRKASPAQASAVVTTARPMALPAPPLGATS